MQEEDDEEEVEWDYVYICNPILGEYITIPVFKCRKLSCTTGYAFGYSASTNQYKVVQTYQPADDDHDEDDHVAEVYTLGTGRWRSIGDALSSVERCSSYYDTLLHSSVHWIGLKERHIEDSLHCFDFEHEEFRQLPSPPYLGSDCFKSLEVVKSCLFAAFSKTVDAEKLELWVMKEYGKDPWTQQFAIIDISSGFRSLAPLVFFNNGKILMMCGHTYVTCYDMEKGTFENSRIFQVRGSYCCPYKYTPCFFSLKDVAGKEKFKKLRQGKRKKSG